MNSAPDVAAGAWRRTVAVPQSAPRPVGREFQVNQNASAEDSLSTEEQLHAVLVI